MNNRLAPGPWESDLDAAIKEVRSFIDGETRLGQAGLSQLCGYSTSVISLFLSGTYNGDVQRVKERLLGAIGLYRDRAKRAQPDRFVETDQSREVEAAIMYALQFKESAAVLAETGCGKSFAARHIAAREFGVIYIQCDRHDFKQSAFLMHLVDAVGIHHGGASTTWRLQRCVTERLRETGYVLVLDDAHYLVDPRCPSRSICLDVVKDLQTIGETPFVLLAVPELWDTIAARVKGDWYAQLKRRIGIVRMLRCQQIQPDDVRRVVEAIGASCCDSVLRALTELARRPGGYGNVNKALRWATRKGNKQITKESLSQFLTACGIVGIRVGHDAPPAAIAQKCDAASVA